MKNINTPEIKFSPRFNKQLNNASDEIKEAFWEALSLFLEDSDHPSLRNHPLRKKFAGRRSIDVTEDWRAIFKETQTAKQKVIIFHMLGTHNKLYGQTK